MPRRPARAPSARRRRARPGRACPSSCSGRRTRCRRCCAARPPSRRRGRRPSCTQAYSSARFAAGQSARRNCVVARHLPLAVELEDAAHLAVGGRLELPEGAPGRAPACGRPSTPSGRMLTGEVGHAHRSARVAGRGAPAPARSSTRACSSSGSSRHRRWCPRRRRTLALEQQAGVGADDGHLARHRVERPPPAACSTRGRRERRRVSRSRRAQVGGGVACHRPTRPRTACRSGSAASRPRTSGSRFQ